jgi:uncharacterized protein
LSDLETIQGTYEAFGRGDIPAVLEAFDPNIEWVEPELAELPYRGTRHGSDVVANEVFAAVPETYDKLELQPEEWIDGGDQVVVLGRANVKGKQGSEETVRFAHVWRMRDGKAARMEAIMDTAALRRALGGS